MSMSSELVASARRAVVAQDLGIPDEDRFKPAAEQLQLFYSVVKQARSARADAA
jgi:hypothetical protein